MPYPKVIQADGVKVTVNSPAEEGFYLGAKDRREAYEQARDDQTSKDDEADAKAVADAQANEAERVRTETESRQQELRAEAERLQKEADAIAVPNTPNAGQPTPPLTAGKPSNFERELAAFRERQMQAPISTPPTPPENAGTPQSPPLSGQPPIPPASVPPSQPQSPPDVDLAERTR